MSIQVLLGQEENQPTGVEPVSWLFAQLGGFLARKRDGKPGVKTIGQGLRRLLKKHVTNASLLSPGWWETFSALH